MRGEEEKQLLESISHKDSAALRRLFDSCAPTLMTLACRYIPDREDASDVVQTSFLAIFDHIDQFQYSGPGSLIAWMQRITANTAISWLRKQKRLRFAPFPEDLADEEDEPDYGTLSQALIFDAIRSLPDGYRTVLNLYVFENLTHREIAALLGISEGTSASQLHRARVLLWKRLKSKVL